MSLTHPEGNCRDAGIWAPACEWNLLRSKNAARQADQLCGMVFRNDPDTWSRCSDLCGTEADGKQMTCLESMVSGKYPSVPPHVDWHANAYAVGIVILAAIMVFAWFRGQVRAGLSG
jgi:hypothetical protein